MPKCTDGPASPDSAALSDVTSLELEHTITWEASFSSVSAPVDSYQEEKLFLLCHGCVGVLMIQFEKICDLSAFQFYVKLGYLTLVLTTCRSCI